MPEQESFNPTDDKYKKVEDLPAGHQDEFTPVEGGFVRAEAKEKFEEAEKIARIANLLDREKISASDILKEEALKDDREKTKKEEIEKEIKERIIRDVEDGRDILFFDSKTRKLDPQYEDFVKDEELIRLYVKNAKYVDAGIIKFLPLSLRNDRELMLAFQKKAGDYILQLKKLFGARLMEIHWIRKRQRIFSINFNALLVVEVI